MPEPGHSQTLEEACVAKGMRMTEQRRVIARVLSTAADHPDAEELHRRAAAIDDNISISTVYRTVKMLEDAGIIARHDFRDGRARYETTPEEHHDHLIDLKTGRVIEFTSEEIERLQKEVAKKLGYRLVDHRLDRTLAGLKILASGLPAGGRLVPRRRLLRLVSAWRGAPGPGRGHPWRRRPLAAAASSITTSHRCFSSN